MRKLAASSCAGAEPTLAVAVRGRTVTAVPAPPVVVFDATTITVARWGGLEEDALFAWSRRREVGGDDETSFGI